MATLALPRDERIGLALAIALHVAVLAALVLTRNGAPPPPRPEPVSVTISDDVAPKSTAPEPAAPAADVAPQIGAPAPAAAPAPALPVPAPPLPAPPAPPIVPAPRVPPPKPIDRASPRPLKQTPAPPTERTAPRPVRKPPVEQAPPQKNTAHTASPARAATKTATDAPAKRVGGSRIGSDFLKGLANAPATAARGQPAAAVGPAQRAALSSAIARQLKPNWAAPQGADAELLVTTLTWDLDAGGRLTGKPRVVSQQGITDANRAQASRHAEQAIRAVELAAPFELPAQYYAAWRHVAAFRFDRKLSQ